MKKGWMLAAVPLMFFGTAAYAGGDVEAGKAKFDEICSECHYEDDFAGETQEDMVGLVKSVVAGEVDHKKDLSGLSEEDIANVAAYFSSFK